MRAMFAPTKAPSTLQISHHPLLTECSFNMLATLHFESP
jgi:hypothetical protein